LSFAFFGMDGFIPLMLTKVRGLTVGWASLVITLASVSWALGSWWASRLAVVWSRASLVVLGDAMVLAGALAVGSGLIRSVPLEVPYAGWTLAGLGIGIAFPTISLVGMERADPGRQTQAIAAVQLTDAFGASLGPGLCGSALAVATSAGTSIQVALLAAFVPAVLAAIVLAPAARRLPGVPTPRSGRPAA
jgi:MFS family permease